MENRPAGTGEADPAVGGPACGIAGEGASGGRAGEATAEGQFRLKVQAVARVTEMPTVASRRWGRMSVRVDQCDTRMRSVEQSVHGWIRPLFVEGALERRWSAEVLNFSKQCFCTDYACPFGLHIHSVPASTKRRRTCAGHQE